MTARKSGNPVSHPALRSRRSRMVIGLSASAAIAGALAGVRSAAAAIYTYTPVDNASDTFSGNTDWTPFAPVSSAANEIAIAGNATSLISLGNLNATLTNTSGNFTLGILDLSGNATGHIATVTINGDATDQLIVGNATTFGVVNLVGVDAGLTYNVNAPILLGNTTTFQGNGTANFKFAGGINGSGIGLVKTGTSTLTLGGTSSVGNLTIGGNSSGGSIVLGNSTSLTVTGSSINIGVGSGTVAAVGTLTAAGGNGTITLNAGSSGTINIGQSTAFISSTGSVISGTGAVVISAGTLNIGVNSNNTAGSAPVQTGTLDLSSASSATINVGTLNLATETGTGAQTAVAGTLKLGNGDVVTATNSIVAGQCNNSGAGVNATITVANNATAAINSPTMILGDRKSSGNITIGSGSTLNLAGNATVGMLLGVADGTTPLTGSTSFSFSSNEDFTAGTLNGNLSALIIAVGENISTGVGTVTGTVLLSSNANHLVINRASGTPVIIAQRGATDTANPAVTGNLTIGNLDATSSITALGNTTAIAIANLGGVGSGTNVSGTLNLNGGTLTIYTTGSAIAGGNGTSTVNFNGMTLIAGNSSSNWITGLTTANLGPNGGFFNSNGNSITLPQVFSGSGNFTKLGTGILSLTKANTYSGVTNIGAGTLALDNSASTGAALSSTQVNVLAGGTLQAKGNVAVSGDVVASGGAAASTAGSISLIDSAINTLTLGGNLSLGTGSFGSFLSFDIAGNGVTGTADLLQINGAGGVTMAGNNTINVVSNNTLTSGTYPLISSPNGGLVNSDFALGVVGGAQFGTTFTLSGNSTAEILTINVGSGNATPSVAYWTGVASAISGDSANNWVTGILLSPQRSNWSTTPDGLTDPVQVPGNVTDVYFTAANASGNATHALATTLDSNYSIKGLFFDTSLAGGNVTSVNIDTNGKTLTLGIDGLTVLGNNTSSVSLSGAGSVSLGSSQLWANNNATTPLNVAVPVSPVSGSTVLTLNGNGTGGVTLGGALADGAGTLALVFDQSGTSLLSGSDTYTGGTTISAGTVQLSGSSTLGNSSVGAVVINGGTLDLHGTSQTIGALSGTGGTILDDASGPATLTAGAGDQSGSFSGTIAPNNNAGTGSVDLVKIGNGTLTLGGTGSVGNLTIGGNASGGSIVLSNGASLTATGSSINIGMGSGTVAAVGTLTAAGGNGTITLNAAAAGTINIGVANGFGNATGSVVSGTGAVVISAGTLNIGVNGNNTAGSGPVQTGTLDLSSASSATINVGTLNLATETSGITQTAVAGTLKLGNGDVVTATNSIVAGVSVNSSAGVVANITTADSSTATINTPTMLLGDRKSSGNITIGSGSTLNLAGNATVGMLLGVADGTTAIGGLGTNGNFSSSEDFTAGTLNGNLSALIIAVGQNISTGVGTVTGTVLLSSNANHLVINRASGTPVIIAQRGATDTANPAVTGNLTIGNLDATSSITALGNTTAIAIANLGGVGSGTNVSGTLNLNGGTLTIYTTGSAIAGGNGNSTVNFNGMTLIAGNSSSNWITGLTTANIASGGALFNTNGNSITVPQSFGGTGSMTKLGAGVLNLTGVSSYGGPTAVNAGTLLANNSNSTGSGDVTVAAPAVLGGSGTILGNVTVSGKITAGNDPLTGAPGTLTINNASATTTLAGNGSYSVKVNSDSGSGTPGTNWDQLVLSGVAVTSSVGSPFAVSLNTLAASNVSGPIASLSQISTWQIGNMTSVSGVTLDGGGTTVLATAGTASGVPTVTSGDSGLFALDTTNFANVSGQDPSRYYFALELLNTGGGYDLDVVYNATPEPTTTLLAIFGAAPLLRRRRRRAGGR